MSIIFRICPQTNISQQIFSPLSRLFHIFRKNEREYCHRKKCFYTKKLIFSLGISYIGYNFFHERKDLLNQNNICKGLALIPRVQALDIDDDIQNVSPRTKFNFLADVVDKTASSVVYVEIIGRHPVTKQVIPISNGSGFIIRSDGLILTNAHVVSHNGRVVVKLFDGQVFEGKVEHFDTESDLATVRIHANNLPVLPLGQSSKLRPGEFVIAMGNPLTLTHTITAGVVSSVNRQAKELGLFAKSDYIQTDAAINVGNSGGPLVNLDCEAIGINTMKVTEGISFAIPSDRATEFLKRIENAEKGFWNPFGSSSNGNKKQKFLGVTMLTLTPPLIQELQERVSDFPKVNHGVMVWRVMVNSPSHESGIKRGDVITAINGKDIFTASDVYKYLSTEDVLQIHIVRKSIHFDVTVKLMDPILS